jgi:hypothetical protein
VPRPAETLSSRSNQGGVKSGAAKRRDCTRLNWTGINYRLTWRRVEKVRLDRAFGGERRLEMTIVHELVEFGTIPGNAQTF